MFLDPNPLSIIHMCYKHFISVNLKKNFGNCTDIVNFDVGKLIHLLGIFAFVSWISVYVPVTFFNLFGPNWTCHC